MGRVVVLVALAVLAVGCSPGKLQGGELEDRLEAGALRSKPLYGASCRPGSEGWHYVCTFRLGSRLVREKAAFVVGARSIEATSGVLALDLPVGPAPGSPDAEAWAEFVARANTICDRRRKEISALPSRAGAQGFVARLGRAARIQAVELNRLQALTPPPGRERARRFSALLDGESELLSSSARLRSALSRRKPEAARKAAGDVEVASRRLDTLARRVGLLRCVQTR